MTVFEHLKKTVLPFVDRCRMEGVGQYRYSMAVERETLYSSAYAAMTHSLLGTLSSMESGEKRAWADSLNGHQDADGLFRDPVIYGRGWYAGDPLWCGRAHLTCHVLTALGCLGHTAAKPLSFLDPYKRDMAGWLSQLDFGERVAWSGNEIMNIGTMLQYARDYQGDAAAGAACDIMLEWLSNHHINPTSGVWGSLDTSDPLFRSDAVQAAYHWWPLFFYDKRPAPFMEAAIDTLLQTQNEAGGFGWGRHNPSSPLDSSACEDIDSIDPLARFSIATPHRRAEVAAALSRARDRVLCNQMPDGGFVFYRGKDFEYGHDQLLGRAESGALFPTWFRTLSLALIDTYFCAIQGEDSPYTFVRVPGFQFWTT